MSHPVTPRALTALVYAPAGEPEIDDPAERYHLAAKTYRETIGRESPGFAALQADPTLQDVVLRAVKRHEQHAAIDLPVAAPLDEGMSSLLARRRSGRGFADRGISLVEVATLLHSGYGVTSRDGVPLRSVPSGGALYPLELYLLASRVDGLGQGVYHYDPLRHVLEQLALCELEEKVRQLHVYPELADAAALLALTGMFWRSRFKYGLRGYRFTLLEAGHVMQNVVLAATALGLSSVPAGGVFDADLEALLRVNGVDESLVYCAAIGPAPPRP